MKKQRFFLLMLVLALFAGQVHLYAQKGFDPGNKPPENAKSTNVWNGSFNYYWGNAANWSLGHIPTSAEDVVIANVGYQPVIVDFSDKECNNLTINSGASVEIRDQQLTVHGNMNVYGELMMTDNSSTLVVYNDVVWYSGSSANVTANGFMDVVGNWDFRAGSHVHLDQGTVIFYGSSNSWIRCYSDDSYFYRLSSYKSSPNKAAFSNLSTEDLVITDYIYVPDSYMFMSYSDNDIYLKGSLYAYGSVDLTGLDNTGTFHFSGSGLQGIFFNGTGSLTFSNVSFAAGIGVGTDGAFTVAKDLSIVNGYLNPNDNTISVGGNWTNTVGDAGFTEGSGRVIFNGASGHQYCSDETFNILEVNKASGAFRVNGTDVVCANYDWTAGAVDVLSGSFTANDLDDNGIAGAWYLNSGGEINLHNPGDWIDLKGDLHIFGGTMNVYGGSAPSYWPYSHDASIEMSDGVLDFHDQGVRIHNTTYSLTEDITGGVIRMTHGFSGNRADFTPSAGTFEFYGSSDYAISESNGCTLFNVNINKSAKAGDTGGDVQLIDKRSGEVLSDGGKSNRIYLSTDFTITNNLTVTAGEIDLSGHELTVAHDCDVYGTLTMDNAADVLSVGTVTYDNLWFYSGSIANLAEGNIYIYSWIVPDFGCSFTASTDNTIHIVGGNIGGGISNNDPGTVYGNIEINKTANYRCYIDDYATEPIVVAGNFTVHPSNIFEMRDQTMIVHGVATDNVSSEIYVYATSKGTNENSFVKEKFGNKNGSKGGYLELDNDFSLNGLMDIGDGTVLAHGRFNTVSGSTMSITSGSLTCDLDVPSNFSTLAGSYSLSSGLIEYSASNVKFNGSSNFSGGTIRLGRTVFSNSGGYRQNGGTTEFIGGGNHYIQLATDDYINDFLFNKTSTYNTTNDLTIKGNLTINSGTFGSSDKNIFIAGNWTNNVGDAGFDEGTGRVIFNGSIAQYCSDEIFNILELDKSSGLLIIEVGKEISCAEYDWTDGGFSVSGTFTAEDLSDNAIYGFYAIYPSGVVNLSNPGSWLDLSGDLAIYGGTLNLLDANGSWWPYNNDASLLMSGGTIDFHNNTIIISSNAFAFNDNITGGVIRTAAGFNGSRADFTPTAGTFEFYGTSDYSIQQNNGCTLYDVDIKKTSKAGGAGGGVQLVDKRSGEVLSDGGKSNQIYLTSDFTITNNLTISAGILDAANKNIYVGGDWTNNVGDAGFLETTSTVTFNGPNDADINTDETFYNLALDKTSPNFYALELDDGITVNVLNDLTTIDGTLEMNLNTKLDVDGDITIGTNSGLNANDGASLALFAGGNFTDNNTVQNSFVGYYSNSETIVFDGTSDQLITGNPTREVFANVIIDKSAGKFKPTSTLDIAGDLLISNGDWDDNVSGLTHYFEGDFQVESTGGYFGSGITTVFKGTLDQDITFNSNTYFTNITIDKTDWTKGANGGKSPEKTLPKPQTKDANSTVRLMTGINIQNTSSQLTIDEGILDLNGKTLLSMGDIEINSGGTLSLDAGAELRVYGSRNINVNNGGTFTSIGTAGDNALVTKFTSSTYYNFNVKSGGTIAAEHTTFEYLGSDGLGVQPGATVDVSKAFNYCTFRNSEPGDGGMLGLFNDQTLTCNEVTFEDSGILHNAGVLPTATNDVTMVNAHGDYAGPEYEYDDGGHLHWTDIDVELDLTVMLEGAYNGVDMNTGLRDAGVLPLAQPFNQWPWNYSGTEVVAAIPANVVDWVLVQLRDSDDPANADAASIFEERAAFLLSDGSIVDIDGVSPLQFTTTYEHKLYPVILQYNHLAVISATNVARDASGTYFYDFTNGAYGGAAGEKEVAPGVWAMIGGDSYEDGIIDDNDVDDWSWQAGHSNNYYYADMDMNGYVDNKDKNDILVPNLGASSQVNNPAKGYASGSPRVKKNK